MRCLIITGLLLLSGCFYSGGYDPGVDPFGYVQSPMYQGAIGNVEATNIQTQMVLDQLAAQRRY